MRDKKRIEPLLEQIKELWLKHPDLRLTQLLSNVAITDGWKNNDLYYLEDDKLSDAILKFELNLRKCEKKTLDKYGHLMYGHF
jgi:uncharacterized protein YihD (DUF1040 family)